MRVDVGGAKPRPISLWTRRLLQQSVSSFAYVKTVPQQPVTGSLRAMRAVKPHLIAIHKKASVLTLCYRECFSASIIAAPGAAVRSGLAHLAHASLTGLDPPAFRRGVAQA